MGPHTLPSSVISTKQSFRWRHLLEMRLGFLLVFLDGCYSELNVTLMQTSLQAGTLVLQLSLQLTGPLPLILLELKILETGVAATSLTLNSSKPSSFGKLSNFGGTSHSAQGSLIIFGSLGLSPPANKRIGKSTGPTKTRRMAPRGKPLANGELSITSG